jgi:ABC-type sulfate transport system permease component
VVVTLYRPFIWESRKVIILFSAMESMIFLYLTLLVFYRNGMKTFRKIFSDPTLFFCLVLTLIFAFAVGISSYNFGALSRYKIPCMPFFGAFLVILLYKGREHVLEKKIAVSKKRKMLQPL